MEKSTEVTAAFTKALPKIELHAHLSGSITRECLREIWLRKRERDSDLQIPDPMIAMPPGKVDYSLKTFFQVFSNLIYLLCSDLESLRYSTRRVLQDFQDDGVRYLELRTTPRESQEHGISKEKYVSTVLEVIDEFKNEAMSTYLILSVDRTKSAAEAEIVVDLAIQFKHRGVVGVELGGNPSKGDVSIFKAAFSKAKQNGLGVTLHFAEVEFSSSPRELTTLLSFQPDRLGHVINVPDDIKDEIVRRKLGLELCLSCNVHAKLITGSYPDHHFSYWRHKECPIILCVGFKPTYKL
ncbi:putative adenosine deaminase [Microsporum canis]